MQLQILRRQCVSYKRIFFSEISSLKLEVHIIHEWVLNTNDYGKSNIFRKPCKKMKMIIFRWTRHVGYCWRCRNEFISDILLWTPSCRWAKAGRPTRTYIQQLCVDTGCSPEDLLEAMDNREGWQERVRDIHADGMTWWWWWGGGWKVVQSKNVFSLLHCTTFAIKL